MQQPSNPYGLSRRSPNLVQEDPSENLYGTLKGDDHFPWEQRFRRESNQPGWCLERSGVALLASIELTDEQTVDGLAAALDYAAARNTDEDDMPSWEEPISAFFSVTKPEIETSMYVKRLVKYAQCSRASFIVVLVYLKRLEDKNSKLAITYYNMHRLLITALMLAAKMLDDRCFSNAHYARVGGISTVREVNRLEIEMLILLDYHLLVSPKEYFDYAHQILQRCAPRPPPSDYGKTAVVQGKMNLSQQMSVDSCTSRRVEEKSSSSALHKQVPIFHGDDRTYQFDAPGPGHEYQVLPLVETSDTHETVIGYRFPGVRSRVYR